MAQRNVYQLTKQWWYTVTRSASALHWVKTGLGIGGEGGLLERGWVKLDELQMVQRRLSADAWNSRDARPAACGSL